LRKNETGTGYLNTKTSDNWLLLPMQLHRFVLSLFACLAVLTVFAQQPQTIQLQQEIAKARQSYNSKKYNTAASQFQKLYNKIRDEELQNEMLFMIAESYRKANNFKQAFEWYEKLVNTKYPDTRILFSYGLLLKNFERYEDANRQFYDYLFEVPGSIEAMREMEACKLAQQWKAHPQKFELTNIDVLNTEFSDYAPYSNQQQLIWSSSRKEATGNVIFEWTGQKCSDFFTSSSNNAVWEKPIVLQGEVNTPYNEGAGSLDATGNTLYYTQCNGVDGKGVNCKLYVSYLQNGKWSKGQELPFSSDSFSVGHPNMRADGKRLFFASDMPGGIGEKDVYYIDYNPLNDTWGKPVNLGPNVNTTEDDMFPYLHTDGQLYYASKGWPGMGGLDLYKTADSAGTFKKAVNLLFPINSGGDDFGITFINDSAMRNRTGFIGFVSSNRQGGKGDDDIYGISIKPFICMVKGKVIEKETGTVIGAANIDVVNASKPIYTIQTNEAGLFNAELPLQDSIKITAVKDKYFRSKPIEINTFNLTADTTIEITLFIEPIPVDDYEFTLQGIYYDLDKAEIRSDAAKVLDSLALILNANPTITIELGSHTDSRAAEDYNLKLSQRRAQSAVDYLVKKGIEKNRLVALGYGETKLVNDCVEGVDCTEEQHQENRRTTIRVLSTDYKAKRK
jgi:peptidoglycan-associated lipoprotein